jgi:hypothetical protein
MAGSTSVPVSASDNGSSPYTITESVSNVTISDSETIDFDIGGYLS